MSKILGIIAEYNPFHNGHLYHLTKSKEIVNPDYTVCIISGNFVQRGNVAIIDKWARAEMALKAGADMVIELPAVYSISSAENYAEGCIKLLDSLGQDVVLSFGSECGDIAALDTFAEILYEEPQEYRSLLAHELQTGISFPKARENALLMYVNDIRKYANTLSCPNNILAIEYLKAIKRAKSSILPITLMRNSVDHNSAEIVNDFASSTHIRELLCNNQDISTLVPHFSYEILARQINSGKSVLDIAAFEKEIFYALRRMTMEQIRSLPDVNESLANTILDAANTCNTYDELIEKLKSKTYTYTRIHRILVYILLGISKDDMLESKRTVPYIRVLGMNEKGKELLSDFSKLKLPVVTSVKDFYTTCQNRSLTNMLNIDVLATNIYTLEYLNESEANLDFTQRIVTLEDEKEEFLNSEDDNEETSEEDKEAVESEETKNAEANEENENSKELITDEDLDDLE